MVENRGTETLRIGTRADVRFDVRLDSFGTDDADIDRLTDEALASGYYSWAIPPQHRRVFREHGVGTQLYIAGGDCLVVPGGVASFVWTGD